LAIEKTWKKNIKHPYIFLATYLDHVYNLAEFFRIFQCFPKNHSIWNENIQKLQNNAHFQTQKTLNMCGINSIEWLMHNL
jgi:hypothetical protein